MNTYQHLTAEKKSLESYINFYQVNTPKREEKVRRIQEIDKKLQRMKDP